MPFVKAIKAESGIYSRKIDTHTGIRTMCGAATMVSYSDGTFKIYAECAKLTVLVSTDPHDPDFHKVLPKMTDNFGDPR